MSVVLADIVPRFGGMRIFIDAESSERLGQALDILLAARLPRAASATVIEGEHHYAVIVMEAEHAALAMQVLRGAGFKVWQEDSI